MCLKGFSLICVVCFLTSCSANTWVRDSSGNVIYHIQTNGKAIHKLKVPDFELETDSKQEPLVNLDLNALKGSN